MSNDSISEHPFIKAMLDTITVHSEYITDILERLKTIEQKLAKKVE